MTTLPRNHAKGSHPEVNRERLSQVVIAVVLMWCTNGQAPLDKHLRHEDN